MKKLLLLLLTLTLALGAVAKPKKVVMIAGRQSHGPLSHEHKAGIMLLAKCLKDSAGELVAPTVVLNGWPQDNSVFEGADAVVIYSDGGGRHPALGGNNLELLGKLMAKGAGFLTIHYAVEPTTNKGNREFISWQGGCFETHWSVNPHWVANFDKLPKHPITNGVKPFKANDEWYFHMRFAPDMKGVTPILSDVAPKETMRRGNGAHSGNPHVRKSVAAGETQHVAWAFERPNGGRGFGFTGGHNHLNWGNDDFRKTVLNAIVWVAQAEVPANGVPSKLTEEDLYANLDNKGRRPRPTSNPGPGASSQFTGPKPVAQSKVITRITGPAKLEADIKGAKELHLVVTDGGNGYACDWADWVEPTLIDEAGNPTKLTSLKWKGASSGFGAVQLNRNCDGGPLRVAGKSVAHGIGTHANSLVSYVLPQGHKFVKFSSQVGLDNGGADQGNCGAAASVQFHLFTQQPKFINAAGGGAQAVSTRAPGDAVANLDVHEKLQAELFAAEPMMLSPSNIDIDHRGRVWVCEIINYRGHRNKRPEGDRILILEDTDGDGKADKKKVFYQGRDIDSPHGVCVLGTVDGKNTRVIVSAGDKVQVFTDVDGDDKPDKKEVLFSGIAGSQHDHGIHTFLFGPDGRLYFNFGNTGRQLLDKDGKPIIDRAGNEVNDRRQPYQQGMVFRCNLDGSDLETLGWNFRNNWMVTVDSFGTIWQSDNDDDGNRAVRINYVMEFGNYGFRSELTGAGWRANRTNIEKTVPERHWHLNDPGVIPNLILTGAGSPTGICVYEGNLLPKEFFGQVIHCDAGPSIVRAYPVKPSGAGYTATILNVLDGAKKDRWFRPSDVQVAPDGSLIVADWYDPGVGGHRMGDLDRGRLFRVTPKGHKGYKLPKIDFTTIDGLIAAIQNPNNSVRHIAWTELNKRQAAARDGLNSLTRNRNSRVRARALWLLSHIKGNEQAAIDRAGKDADENVRGMALRIARQHKLDVIPIIKSLSNDKSPVVRRECLIALRHNQSKDAPALWAKLANMHDGKDRWYLEALGLAADKQENKFFDEWMKTAKLDTAGARDVVWRNRGTHGAKYLADIILDKRTPKADKPRYMRALDFIPKSKEKDDALARIALGAL
ncbi:MAG: dehydrogenase [Verrucomicrobiales bacterium]|nr:dehydrogenase [Verrucomicrobiales bacterium]|tara:strand:- start:7557 stop:10895 length:3339 start_codon:yes stop_codon:yes gene_type:complete